MRALVITLALACAVLGGCERPQPQAPTAPTPTVRIGGPFSLIDTGRRPVTEATLRGRPTAIFFGYTYCPDVCPTTLAEMTAALQALGPDGDRLNVIFVSVDPGRDTPEQMKLYLSNFDPRIRGFTGTQQAVDAAAKAYHVYHQKVPGPGGGYTVDHTSTTYLFDRRGEFVEPLGYGFPHETVVARLKSLVARR
jgi:protein SCO1/2